MNWLTYPCTIMRITQGYESTFSHAPNAAGKPRDYPIDESGEDGGRSWFFCPCDEMIITRLAGVGVTATNTIWLTSTTPVDMPSGKDFVTIMVVHPEDDDLSKRRVGEKFTRGQPLFREGNDGKSTGNHFHMSFGRGKLVGNGWVQNTQGAWVINVTGGAIKPEDACYVDPAFTKILNQAKLPFRELPKETAMQTVKAGPFTSVAEAAALQFILERRGFSSNVEPNSDKWMVNVTKFPDGTTPTSVVQSLSGLRCYSEIK